MFETRVACRALLVGGLLTAAAATGCADSTETTTPANSMTERTPVLTSPGAPTVSVDAARQLCDMMRPEISTWRDEGPTVGKVAFNGTVHNWAMRNSGVNVAVMNDRAVVDTITTAECPDVREDALQALQIDNLADGLAGF